MSVRVRIAPSPTGNLHIGTTRTALFNYLFARHHGGTFILRVEDTDRERSRPEYTENILTGLKNLGLSWDEGPGAAEPHGPYYQSQRQAIYERYLQQLIEQEKIYPCFCSPEELQIERAAAEAAGVTYVYSRKCRQLDAETAKTRLSQGDKRVWRLKVPDQPIGFDDLIRGEIHIDASLIGDIIIARGDLTPMYNFAVVVDDLHMIITHVLRGEDHISNTPKQLLIYEALGAKPPRFGHAAMMLAPDRSKLSKRHGATSVQAYLDQGYLPEALINYLALLGWSAPAGREILSLEELVEAFDIQDVTKAGAVFDVEKLKWVNAQWLRRLGVAGVWPRLRPMLEAAGVDIAARSESWWHESLGLVLEKMTLLPDYLSQCDFLLQEQLVYAPAETDKAFGLASAAPVLDAFSAAFETLEDWSYAGLQQEFETLKSALPYKPKDIMWPVRAAISGRVAGADLQHSIRLLGRERTLERLRQALSHINRPQAQE